MKTILVPTDFSIIADSAIHYAIKLASLFDMSMIIYHSFIPFESGFYPLTQSEKENLETENILRNRLDKIRTALLKTNSKIPITIHIDRGPESIRIIQFCKNNKIDLIVMGTKGASGLKEKVIGSFTANLMTKSSCPVLAIPENYKFKIPKKIIYATNYNRKDNKPLQYLLDINSIFKSEITILHVDKENNEPQSQKEFNIYKRKVETKHKGISLQYFHISGKKITKVILQKVLNDKTDLLALSPIKRKDIWNRLFHKSITKTTSFHIPIPLLAIPIK